METQWLVDLAKQMNMAGKELVEFFRAERALAMERRIRINGEKKKDEERIAADKERILGNIRRKMKRGLGNIRRKMK